MNILSLSIASIDPFDLVGETIGMLQNKNSKLKECAKSRCGKNKDFLEEYSYSPIFGTSDVAKTGAD